MVIKTLPTVARFFKFWNVVIVISVYAPNHADFFLIEVRIDFEIRKAGWHDFHDGACGGEAAYFDHADICSNS